MIPAGFQTDSARIPSGTVHGFRRIPLYKKASKQAGSHHSQAAKVSTPADISSADRYTHEQETA